MASVKISVSVPSEDLAQAARLMDLTSHSSIVQTALAYYIASEADPKHLSGD